MICTLRGWSNLNIWVSICVSILWRKSSYSIGEDTTQSHPRSSLGAQQKTQSHAFRTKAQKLVVEAWKARLKQNELHKKVILNILRHLS